MGLNADFPGGTRPNLQWPVQVLFAWKAGAAASATPKHGRDYKNLLAYEKVYEESHFRPFYVRQPLFAILRHNPSYAGATQVTLSGDVTIY